MTNLSDALCFMLPIHTDVSIAFLDEMHEVMYVVLVGILGWATLELVSQICDLQASYVGYSMENHVNHIEFR